MQIFSLTAQIILLKKEKQLIKSHHTSIKIMCLPYVEIAWE